LGVVSKLPCESERLDRCARVVAIDERPSAQDDHAHDAKALVSPGTDLELVEVQPAWRHFDAIEEASQRWGLWRGGGGAAQRPFELVFGFVTALGQPGGDVVRDPITRRIQPCVSIRVGTEEEARSLAIAVPARKRCILHDPFLFKALLGTPPGFGAVVPTETKGDILPSALSKTMERVAWILAGVLIVILAFEGRRVAHLLPEIERFVESLGPWGPVFYVLAIIVLEPVLFPNAIFGIAAGVVFGLPRGLLYYCSAVYAANLLVYPLGRRLLRRPVLRMLERRASIRGVVRRAKHEGAGLVFWLRLLPLNPAVFSYAFGAIEVPLGSVALGSLGMLPHLALDVYLGAVASHVTKMAGQGHAHWGVRGIALVLGLIAFGVVLWRIARVAKAHLGEADAGLDE